MPSPFPGMDPYLEDPATWTGVHAAILGAIFERLGPAVRPKYAVRFEVRGDDEVPEPSLRVIDVRSRGVVTVIELLSPTNKTPGSVRQASFVQKRREVLAGDASWMAIDLLRDGLRTPRAAHEPVTEYRVYLSRGGLPREAVAWPVRLADRLPVVGVPLRGGDADVPPDLQAAVAAAIERGSYDLDADPVPPLTGPAAEWARATCANRP